MEIIAQRVFSPLYIYLDIAFLVFFLALMIIKKKYLTVLFALAGGILYMIVDFGIFHLLMHTRSITGGNLFWVLLWMSMSYGITNFAWIWLFLSRDEHLKEWSFLIIIWWIACPMIASTFGKNMGTINISRTTGGYHGYMAIMLIVGYAGLIAHNILVKDKEKKINILWLFAIGVAVQFAWEAALLVGGIRSAEFLTFESKIMTLVVNSLVETNLGMPYIYFIHKFFTKQFSEDLKKLPLQKTAKNTL